MMKLFSILMIAIGPAALLMIGTPDAEQLSALEERGLEIAEKHCSRCHVVNEDNRFGGISSTPSFPLLVNGLDDWEERFSNFYSRLPHPSVIRFEGDGIDREKPVLTVPVELLYSDVEALTAYARTLKKPEKN